MRKILFTILCLGALLSTTCHAQDNNYKVDMPNIPYLSPEAASLGKYGEIPVSEYTGVPDISIPLYTAKSGELELPITLSYHASGIKVDQEATWVGLGWDIMAGGCISRIVSGAHDEQGNTISRTEWQELLSEPEDNDRVYKTYSTNGDSEPLDYPHSHLFCSELVQGKGEPDLFTANFNGYNFTFIINPFTNIPQMVGKISGNFIIDHIVDSNHQSTWKIIDDKGIEYHFEKDGIEMYYSSSSSPSTAIASWFLTKIKHPVKGIIRFNYEHYNNSILKYPSYYETEGVAKFVSTLPSDYAFPNGYFPISLTQRKTNINYSDAYQSKSYLTSIITDRDSIAFHLSDRVDLKGGSKLDSITITDVFSKTNIKKRIHFKYSLFPYSYFNNSNDYEYYSLMDRDENRDYKYKRLKLDNISVDDREYGFEYNTKELPSKISYSRDFWGYYNHQPNKTLLCTQNLRARANITGQVSVFDTLRIGDANRYVDPDYIKAGILECITYPTGGKTRFEYEPNTFTSTEWYPTAHDVGFDNSHTTTYTAECNQYATSEERRKCFSLSYSSNAKIIFSVRGNTGDVDISGACGRLYKINNSDTTMIAIYNVRHNEHGSHRYYLEKDTLLLPGDYYITSYFPEKNYDGTYDDETHASLSVKINSINSLYAFNGESYGGGLRIKGIQHYDENGRLQMSEKYDYTDNGRTTGFMIHPVSFLECNRYAVKKTSIGNSSTGEYGIAWWEIFDLYTLSSSVKIPAITSLNSVPVGYSKVTVTRNDVKKITEFFNNYPLHNWSYSKSNVGQDCCIFSNYLNGFKTRERIYDAISNVLLQDHRYDYSILVDSCSMLNAFAKDRLVMQTESPYIGSIADGFHIYTYPFLTQRINTRKETISTLYGDSYINDTIYNYYTNPYYQLSSIKRSSSIPSEYYETKIHYLDHFLNSNDSCIFKVMKQKNMLSQPILTTELYNNTILSRSKNNYGIINDIPLVLSKDWAQGNNDYSTRISYQYDAHGNIIQATKEDGSITSYLWAYNNTLPVAKIEGISYEEIIQAIPPNYINTLNSAQRPEYYIPLIRSRLTDKEILFTSYTYDPIYGILSETAPNGLTTYYEYDNYGRLSSVKDHNRNLLKSFEYNYAQ